ncbi:MAG TPA: LamG-like jellyroll fold domain-containing protein, partial [Clostridia bacterium]|nr:LamG-like jellyroll fold domain-containing protein [Clostridia bacterium]
MIDLRLAFRRNWALYPTPSGLARIACLLLVLAAFAAGHAADWVAAPSGLVGWWPGDGDARDIVGGHHGILRGGATANVEGYIGKGFSFDGTNKYVEIPNAPALNPSELSVECWVRFNNLDAPGTSAYIGQQYLVFKQNTRFGDFEAYVLSKDRTHADIILWEVTSAEGKLVRIDSTSSVGTNEWYHLVGVRGPNYIKLYFNGKLEAQAAVDFPQDYGNYPLYFGTSGQDYYDRRLNGVLDEVCLYRRVLTAQEVASLYAAGRAGKSRPAQVTVSGGGYVHPNYNRHLLKPGRVYQMTAYPAPGYVFSNWTGSVTSTKRTLSFFAQKSLALHANFVPNPFRPVAGTYRGLFYESDAARHGSSGIALLFVTSRGTFTGTLRVAGHSYPLVGRFDLEGKTSLTVRRANLGSVSLQLQLDLHQGSDRITGTVASGTWQAALTADRLVYGQSNPCPQIGRYTLA